MILSTQPITRLALLIMIFIMSAFLFLLLDYYFLGLTYIIVYVGDLDFCLASHDQVYYHEALRARLLLTSIFPPKI
jgi:hypothetical protein